MATVGKTTAGSTSAVSSFDKMAVSTANAGATGTLTAGTTRAWLSAAGSCLTKMVVYSDSGGAPNALLAVSDEVTITSTSASAVDYAFSGGQQITITSGVDYWFGLFWQDPGTPSINLGRDGTASARLETQPTYPTAPSSFGTGTALAGPIDSYLTFTVGGGGGGTGTGGAPTIRSVGTGGLAALGDTTVSVTKPTGLVAGDYLLAVQGCDADVVLTSMTAPSGFTTLASQAPDSANNIPAQKIYGKVASAGDASASSFTFGTAAAGDCAIILTAITINTFLSSSPVTVSGAYNTQARTATMAQDAPSMTGVVNGLLITAYATDTNGTTETYPTSGPAGMTRITTRQGYSAGPYAMTGAYSQALTAAGATGTKTVSPAPSGITTNGWVATSLMVAPNPVAAVDTTDFFMSYT